MKGIANNPVYAGYLTFNETLRTYKKPPGEQKLYEGIHERIIPRDEFWSLQDVLDTRRGPGGKRQTSNYYFSTILKCGRCSHSMSGHRGGTLFSQIVIDTEEEYKRGTGIPREIIIVSAK